MPNILKQLRLLVPALILALMLSPLVISEQALALPTSPITSGDSNAHQYGNGYFVFGNNQGPNFSSSWTSSESYLSDHSDDNSDDYEDGWGDNSGDHDGDDHEGYNHEGDGEDHNGGNGYNDDFGDDNGNYDGDGDDGNTSPVPEPTTALLMSLGLAGVAFLKSRHG